MYGVIETYNNNKKSYCYLNDSSDILDFYEKKKKEFLNKRFTITGIRLFKTGKLKGIVRYFQFRKIKYVNKMKREFYYSYSIFKLSNNKIIEKYQSESGIFTKAYDEEKRKKNMCFRFGEFEYKILLELANKNKVKPSDILRASLLDSFGKELEKIKKGLKND